MIKNTPAVRVTLCTTFLPSLTTSGRFVKSLSSRTIWEICLAASLPCATAIEQSAALRASRSLTHLRSSPHDDLLFEAQVRAFVFDVVSLVQTHRIAGKDQHNRPILPVSKDRSLFSSLLILLFSRSHTVRI